jgi:type I restriction enzyme, S subunit
LANEWSPSGWETVKLGEIGKLDRGRSRHRPRHAPHLYGGKYPFVQTGDIKASGGRITSFEQTYSEAGLAQSRLWPAGTLAITIAATIAETGILTFPACFPDSVVGFLADETKCDVYFIEYMFRYLRQKIQSEASGSVQDNINLEILNNLAFPLPPLIEQRAIARILGALDGKIELNRRLSHTLESMAQALFKSWFVDFDPVTAKAQCRAPFGMSAETAALFPTEFVDSELGAIPKGWEVTTLGKVLDITKGRSYTSSELAESITALVTLKSFNRGGGYKADGLKPFTGKFKPEQILKPGELVIACTDITQNADVVGRPAIIPQQNLFTTLVASLDLWILRPNEQDLSVSFLYNLLRTVDYVNYIIGYASGTTVLHLSKDGIPNYQFVKPSIPVFRAFNKFAKSIYERLNAMDIESRTLASIRDALLPHLLSGEVRVKGEKA